MNNTGLIVFITGASSGIGYATTQLLLKSGWYVIGTIRNPADADKLQRDFGNRFHSLIFDVTAPVESHQDLANQLQNILDGRPLHALIHNAGIAQGGPLVFQPESEFRAIFETNVLGVFKLTQVLFPLLIPGSRVIMISSVSGKIVTPFIGSYAASKFALEAMADAYRNELGMLGIQVISIQPGPVKTPIWSKARQPIPKYHETPFSEILALQEQMIDKTEALAIPVEKIAELIKKALEAPRPATRYLAVKNPWIIRLLTIIPDRLKDKLIMKRLKNLKKPGV